MARRNSRKTTQRNRSLKTRSQGTSEVSPSKESIKAAEDLALTAFASGLKLAAAFGTVAAKTTSLALASLATGADKFSELVRQEALGSQKKNHVQATARGSRPRHKNRRDRRLQQPRELMARN